MQEQEEKRNAKYAIVLGKLLVVHVMDTRKLKILAVPVMEQDIQGLVQHCIVNLENSTVTSVIEKVKQLVLVVRMDMQNVLALTEFVEMGQLPIKWNVAFAMALEKK